jgi:hypothetical protein
VHIDLKGPFHIAALQNKPGLKSRVYRLLPATPHHDYGRPSQIDIVWKDNDTIDTRDKSALDKYF